MIVVREATDLDAIADVVRSGIATLRETYRPIPGTTPLLPPRTRLVALVEGRVVGTVEYYRDADHIHLIGLFVDAAFRRRGIARALVEHLGPDRRSLYTIRETGNVAVFERLGFRVVAEQVDATSESDRHAELHEVYMEL